MKHTLSKKGVSLAELVVVLALLAIVSTMVTSFCILISGYNGVNRKRAAITEQLSQTEQIVTDFLLEADALSGTLTVTETTLTVNRDSGGTYTLTVNGDMITAILPSGQRTQRIANLTAVTFESLTGNGGHPLLLCTITYKEPKLKESNDTVGQTFAVSTKMLR